MQVDKTFAAKCSRFLVLEFNLTVFREGWDPDVEFDSDFMNHLKYRFYLDYGDPMRLGESLK